MMKTIGAVRKTITESMTNLTIPRQIDKLEGLLRDAEKGVSLQTEREINGISGDIKSYITVALSYDGRLNRYFYDKAVKLISCSAKVVGDKIAGYQQERLRSLDRLVGKYRQQIIEPLGAVA